jgi:nucleoside-diphosphate-sugar epimerase
MRIAVTGGSGFLGRAVVSVLSKIGHKLVIIDNNFRGNKNLLEKDIEFHNVDIRNQEEVIRATKNIDCVIHLAFINGTKYFYENPELVTEVGIRGMLNLHEAIKINRIDELIVFSTSETYQEASIIPTPENIPLVIPNILNPRYSYGGSKIATELITVNMTSKFLKSWKIIRPHNIYGPNMGKEHVIPALFNKAKHSTNGNLQIEGSGKQTRSFCEIEDFAQAFELIFLKGEFNEIYNVGTLEEIQIKDLAKKVLATIGIDLVIEESAANPGETQRRCPDTTKIKSLGFQPSVSLDQGLLKYWAHLNA